MPRSHPKRSRTNSSEAAPQRRQADMRGHLAYLAARLIAEDGVQDYGAAKRKAARQAGIADTQNLPTNAEIEAALRSYQALYQSAEQPAILHDLREVALRAMELLSDFRPYLTGSVLTGTATAHSDVNLQLFVDSSKDVELFLLNRGIEFATELRRVWLGDRPTEIPLLSILLESVPVSLAIYASQHERITQKHRADGRPIERARVEEVRALVEQPSSAG